MDDLLAASPVGRRLSWLLEGLNGGWADVGDADNALAPEFTAQVPLERLVVITNERAARLAPLRLVGLDVEDRSATARLRANDGRLWVARTDVEPDPPYRIVWTSVQPWVPDDLTSALPSDFAAPAASPGLVRAGTTAGRTPVLLVFSGVPGSGKSTVAEDLGNRLGVPVFAGDWLLGALSPFGMRHRDDLAAVAEELLVTLAYRELSSGRSAIIDTTTEDIASRRRWQSLAEAFGACFQAVVCVCSDSGLHRERVESRQRGIPGWQDAGDWADVSSRLARFAPWQGALEVDTADGLDHCVRHVLAALPPPSDRGAAAGSFPGSPDWIGTRHE